MLIRLQPSIFHNEMIPLDVAKQRVVNRLVQVLVVGKEELAAYLQ